MMLLACAFPVVFCSSTNMVLNPNFQLTNKDGSPAHWRTPATVFARSTAVALPPATASLEYNNTNPKLYQLAAQTVVGAVAGRQYKFSAAIKVAEFNISAGPGYASVCVQWDDQEGKWSGGQYPHGPGQPSTDWTTVSGDFVLPASADPTSVAISVYVRPISNGLPTPTGVVYFDNISMWYAPKPPLSSVLLSPVYRGRVTAADAKPISLRARVRLETPQTVALVSKLIPKQPTMVGAAINDKVVARLDAGPFVIKNDGAGSATQPLVVDMTFDEIDARKTLVPGDYTAELTLVKISSGGLAGDKGNVTLQTVVQNITRMDDTAPPPRVFIDQQKRTIVDGEPFFPMGFYFSTSLLQTGSTAIGNLSGTAFNYVMPYGEASSKELDVAAAADLKVGFSLKDIFFGSHWCPKAVTSRAAEETYFKERVQTFKNHSALLAWYINDELTPAYLPQLKAHQQWLIEGDPDHPSWEVLCEDGEFDEYMETFDILGSDPYPIGNSHKNASGVHAEVNTTVYQTDYARPVWEVIQAMNWADYHKGASCSQCHTPTYAETRSMVWQSIAAGANGIVFYEYNDLLRNPDVPFETSFTNLKDIASEVMAQVPILLSSAGGAPSPMIAGGGKQWLMTRAQWTDDSERVYVLFVVSDGAGGGEVTFDLSNSTAFGCKSELHVTRAMEPNPRSSKRSVPPQKKGCSFTDTVPMLAALAYRVHFS